MCHGGVGTISATANVNPAAIHKLYAEWDNPGADPDGQQAKLNAVRAVFSQKSFPSMIAAMKQGIALSVNDPEWARVRPPLMELTAEQARTLATELQKVQGQLKVES
jgi:4-hydroxy-tetrahydrodipicolinate synthase